MIIYTCITNGYDEIPNNNYYDPDVQYICFTDGTVEKKGPWEFRDIPFDHECPLRRALYPKIMQHKIFPIGSEVVWVDGCYVHTKEFVDFSKTAFPRTYMDHPKKFTYYEEVIESFIASYNSKEDIIKITEELIKINFDFKKYVNPILASFWNTVENPTFHEKWWKFAQISNRCDQIGFIASKDESWKTVDWTEPGMNFSGVGGSGRVGRKKKHPTNGDSNQWEMIDEMLLELKKMTRLHPAFYCKHWRNKNKLEEWISAHK